MAMVGQYHGPEGSAALAVVAPVWNIIYSLGLLMGIGGSVLFSTIRGKADSAALAVVAPVWNIIYSLGDRFCHTGGSRLADHNPV